MSMNIDGDQNGLIKPKKQFGGLENYQLVDVQATVNSLFDNTFDNTNKGVTVVGDNVQLAGNTVNKESETADVKLTRKDRKSLNEFILAKVAAALSQIQDRNDLIAQLDTAALPDEYKKIVNSDVKFVLDKLQGKEYNSLEDIEKIEKEVRKEISKDGGDNKSFKKEILDMFINDFKVKQRNKEANEVKEKFNELKAEHPKESRAAIGKMVIEYFRDTKAKNADGSDGKKLINTSYYRETLNMYPNPGEEPSVLYNLLMEDAKKSYTDAVDEREIGKDGITKKGKMYREVKNDAGNDWYTRHAVRENDGLLKSKSDRAVYYNKSESVKAEGLSKNELNNALGKHIFRGDFKNNGAYLYAMQEKGLITLKDDGKYDVTKLSELIAAKIGADLTGNNQLRQFVAYDEIERTLNEILATGDTPNISISKADTIALMKACGYGYENGYFKALAQNMFGDLVKDGVQGAVVGKMLADASFDVKTNKEDEVDLVIKLTGNDPYLNVGLDIGCIYKQLFTPQEEGGEPQFDPNLLDENGERINFIKTLKDENGNTIGWHIKGHKDVQQIDTKKVDDLGLNVTSEVITYVALSMLKTALDTCKLPEKPVAVTQFDNKTSYEEYNKQIDYDKSMPNGVKVALKALASAFYDTETNEWNSEGYRQVLNKIAGDGSVLNMKELANGVDKMLKEFNGEVQKDPDKEAIKEANDAKEAAENELAETKARLNATEQALSDCGGKEKTPVVKSGEFIVNEKFDTITEKIGFELMPHMDHSGWPEMAYAYPCLQKYSPKIAGRIMKIVQGTKPDCWADEALLVQMAKDSFALSTENFKEKYREQFDNFDNYTAYLGYNMKNIILPDVIGECPRDKDNKMKAKKASDPPKDKSKTEANRSGVSEQSTNKYRGTIIVDGQTEDYADQQTLKNRVKQLQGQGYTQLQ